MVRSNAAIALAMLSEEISASNTALNCDL